MMDALYWLTSLASLPVRLDGPGTLPAAMEPRERSMGWIAAPTYDLADKVFREVVIIGAEHLRHRIVTLREAEKRLVLRNMAGGLAGVLDLELPLEECDLSSGRLELGPQASLRIPAAPGLAASGDERQPGQGDGYPSAHIQGVALVPRKLS